MKFNKDFSAIHGYLCADGYVSRNMEHQRHKYYLIGFRNQNTILLRDFQSKFKKVFGIKPKICPDGRCRTNSKEIYFKLMENGPYFSQNWRFPELSKNNLRFWLRAFFDCEASVTVRKGQDRRISAESINHNSLLKLKNALLVKFNINSSISVRKNRKTSVLNIFGKENLVKFEEKIGFLHPQKKRKLQKAINSFIDYNWSFPCKSLEKKDFLKKMVKEKGKVKKPYIIRICSIVKKNLEVLSEILLNFYNIESKIYKLKNGQGNTYFVLRVQKKESVRKLIEMGFLNKKEKIKIKIK